MNAPRGSPAALGLVVACLGLMTGADWPQFRGADSSGIAEETNLPVTWGENQNLAWVADLPGRGLSGPIVMHDRVVLTASSGVSDDHLHIMCFDEATGKQLWQRQFWATGSTLRHPKMCVATPTPASDGTRIFAAFSTNDVICLDLDGNLEWLRGLTYDYPDAFNTVGLSSSPVVAGETLVLQVENFGNSFAVGLDVLDGVERWKLPRPKLANWSSSAVQRAESGLRGATPMNDVVLMQSSQDLLAIEPATGKELWKYPQPCANISSTTVARDLILVPANGLTALRCPVGQRIPEVLWQANRGDSTATAVCYRGRVFTLNTTSVLESVDAHSGESLWRLRLKGPFSASPVCADGRVYLFNEQGESFVVESGGDQGLIAGTSQLGEPIFCTPAVANQAIYVRGDRHLWKIAKE